MTDTEVNSLLTAGIALTPGMSSKDINELILRNLRALGGSVQGEDTISYEGTKVVLPVAFKNNLSGAIRHLDEVRKSEETNIDFNRMFGFRQNDVAVAFSKAMSQLFGGQGIGMVTKTIFGDIEPEIRSVEVGLNEHAEAPFGKVGFSVLKAVFNIGVARHPELGIVGMISCTCPRKFRKEVEGFFDVVQSILDNASIYRGKAITAATTPGFFNENSVRPESVIYTPEVMKQLSANVWTPIRNAQRLRDMKRSLKRTVLLHGKYGTGKSLAGVLTAQVAVQQGWTFIIVRTQDNPIEALQTAKMYAPAVVLIEDFDLLTANKTREEIDRVLDVMDSVSNKGQEVITLLTTNFLEAIDQAALRPGRIDHIIHFEDLHEEGYADLVRSILPAAQMAADINFSSVTEAFRGLFPSFAKEAIEKALLYSMDREDGEPDLITTEDLVNSAAGVREQLATQQRASEAQRARVSLDDILVERLVGVLNRTSDDGDTFRVREAK